MEYLLLEDLEREKMITLGRGNIISKIDINAIPGNYPIYSSSATGNGEFGRYGKYMFEDERVTWSIDGGGRPFYREKHKYSVTNVCGWLKINTDKLITKFVYYCLLFQWNMLKFDYTYKAHPSIIKEIYRIPMLPISIQKVIVEQLDKINNQISKNTNTLLYFEELTKSRFIELFGDPIENSKNFKTIPLKKLGILERGRSQHRPRNDASLLNGPYPLIQTGDVKNADTYITEYTSTYSEKGLKQSKMWKKGTLCITIAANIAETAILGFDACFPDSVVGFVPNDNVTTIFIHNWFKFLQPILEEKAPSVAQKNLNLEILGNVEVIVPEIDLQIDFENSVKQIDKLKFNVQKQIKYYQELLDLKMHEYFDVEEED